mgnify:CR=1 FL=1
MSLKEHLTTSFLAYEDKFSANHNEQVNDIRSKAFNHFEEKGFPTKKDEEWKYTSLKSVLKHDYKIFPKIESAIEFKVPSISIDFYGNYTHPQKVIFSGAMASQRIGELLPFDYGL